MPDIGMAALESEAETNARVRAERIAELRALCEDVLEDLIQDGRGLAAAVAQRAETEINSGFSEYHGTMVLRGASPATKGFMQVSQSVRQSIRLPRDVLEDGWWADVTAPVAAAWDKATAARQARDGTGHGDGAEGEAEVAERAERAERVERAETLGGAVGPGQVAAMIAALREGLAEVAEAVGVVLPKREEVPCFAAKPQYACGDAPDDAPPETRRDPPD